MDEELEPLATEALPEADDAPSARRAESWDAPEPQPEDGSGPAAGGDPQALSSEASADFPAEEDPVAEAAAPAGPGPGDSLSDEELGQAVAALLFASPDPLTLNRLADLLERPRKERLREAVAALAQRLAAAGLPLVVREIAGGWRLFTEPGLAEVVARLGRVKKTERISGAALETLSIIAYRQPVTKAEIEAIRGVQAGPILRTLVDRGLVRVAGRADQPGAPLEYATTREFLDRFALPSLDELPRDGELVQD